MVGIERDLIDIEIGVKIDLDFYALMDLDYFDTTHRLLLDKDF